MAKRGTTNSSGLKKPEDEKLNMEQSTQEMDVDWQVYNEKEWRKAFDDDKDELDECHGCNIYYEIMVRIKSIVNGKDNAESKVKRVQDLVYIGRLL